LVGNETVEVCAPAYNVPPQVNLSLGWGQTATINNFTASCQAWYDANMTECPIYNFTIPQVSANLSYGECNMTNNFTACCSPFVDLNITEPEIVYEGCPQINRTIDIYPKSIYTNFTYGLVVRCLDSLVQPNCNCSSNLLEQKSIPINCSAGETRNYDDRNLTLMITQCPPQKVCEICNRSDDQVLNCSIKASFCYEDLQDLVSFDAFKTGNARAAFNDSKNALLYGKEQAENQTNACSQQLNRCNDNYAALKETKNDNSSVGWTAVVILGIFIVGNEYRKSQASKLVNKPMVRREGE